MTGTLRGMRTVVVAVLLVVTLLAAPAAAFECHTALVLALDASDSVDPREADLQRRGIAQALRDPAVSERILAQYMDEHLRIPVTEPETQEQELAVATAGVANQKRWEVAGMLGQVGQKIQGIIACEYQ